jgi:hypothetical protein
VDNLSRLTLKGRKFDQPPHLTQFIKDVINRWKPTLSLQKPSIFKEKKATLFINLIAMFSKLSKKKLNFCLLSTTHSIASCTRMILSKLAFLFIAKPISFDQIISNKCTLMHFGDNLVKILYVILEKVMGLPSSKLGMII